MKKNTLVKLLAVLVMCFMIGAVLVACGEAGPKGDKGDKGDTGATGAPGADGVTPTLEIKDGYWYINGENTGVMAEGKNGEDLDDCDDHDWSKTHVLSAHTVAQTGVTLVICANCGDADLVVDNHVFDTVVAVVAPTLEDAGVATLVCDCGKEVEVDLPSLMMGRSYMINPGNCITPDTYYYGVYGVDENGFEYAAEVSFEVAAEYDCVPAVAFDKDNVDETVWKLSEEDVETDACVCEMKEHYTTKCTICNETIDAFGNPKGHDWGEWHIGENDTDTCDCEWIPIELSECANCDCEKCIRYNPLDEAKGHTYGEWVKKLDPTTTTEGYAERECLDCKHDACKEELTLPALSVGEGSPYTYTVITDSTCDVEGQGVYTYTCDDGSTLEILGAIAVKGHRFSAESAYEITTLPTADANGVVAITCDVCGETIEYLLRPLMMGGYIVKHGHCLDTDDVYTATIVGEGADQGELQVTFEVNGGYTHQYNGSTDKPAKEECTRVYDEEFGRYYYVYKCELCGTWVVAYFE